MNNLSYYKKKIYKIGGFRKKAILDFVKKDGLMVLDIGCGNGEMGKILKKEKGCKVHGVDVSSSSVDEAKMVLDEVFCFDIESSFDVWPDELKHQKYDVVVISEVLEHLFDSELFLYKVKKILKRDGEVIVTVPNLLFWKSRLRILFGGFDYTDQGLMDQGHIHFFSWKSFRNLIWSTGFMIIEQNNHVPTRGTKIWGKFFPGLFSYQFVVKIRKNT